MPKQKKNRILIYSLNILQVLTLLAHWVLMVCLCQAVELLQIWEVDFLKMRLVEILWMSIKKLMR